MYLFHPRSTLAVYMLLLVGVKALPQSSPLVQRAPTDLRNNRTIELDDIRDILVGSERSPPTGKVTLEADDRRNMDPKWLVYDVKGLVDGNGEPMTATATTRADGSPIDPELIDEDVLLGYGHDGKDDQRWWMLESKIPRDLTGIKNMGLVLNDVSGKVTGLRRVKAENKTDRDDIDDGLFYFILPQWVDGTSVHATTRINGGKMDPAIVKAYESDKSIILYGYETMKDPSNRRRWWLVSRPMNFPDI